VAGRITFDLWQVLKQLSLILSVVFDVALRSMTHIICCHISQKKNGQEHISLVSADWKHRVCQRPCCKTMLLTKGLLTVEAKALRYSLCIVLFLTPDIKKLKIWYVYFAHLLNLHSAYPSIIRVQSGGHCITVICILVVAWFVMYISGCVVCHFHITMHLIL